MANHYAAWLMPDEAASASLKNLIDHLASRASGERFYPHITLFAAHAINDFHMIFQRQTKSLDLVLNAESLVVEEDFYAGFYIKFTNVSPIFELCSNLNMPTTRFVQHCEPHLSLLYGNQGLGEKQALAKKIMLPAKIEFDRIQLWSVRGEIQSWHLIAEKNLIA